MIAPQWRLALEAGVGARARPAVFGLPGEGKSISTIDADGVALAAIQGLNAKLDGQNAELRAQVEALLARVESLESSGNSQTSERAP